MSTGPGSLGPRAVRGASWSAVAFASNKLIVFAASAVLAHLLTPRQFGLVAIAMVVVGYVERLSEGGLESAVISFPGASAGDDRRCFDHALGISLGLGAVCAVVGVATAPLVARLFGEPEVTPILAVLSVLYLTTSVRQMLSGGLARRMQFARRLTPELVRAATKAAVMIALAVGGHGVWALTIGHVAGAASGLVTYWLALGEPIRPRFSRRTSASLLRLGGAFSLLSVLATVVQNADYVMLALRAGSESVGLYSMGFRIPELTVLAVPIVASQALMAAFVRVADSPARLRRAYLTSLGVLATVLTPIGVGLTLVADDAVPLLFGDQWTASVAVVRRVGLFGLAAGLAFPLGDALKATDRVDVLVRLAAARLTVTLPLLWLAAGRDLAAVADVHLALSVSLLVVSLVMATVMLGASPGAQLAALRGPALAGLVLVATVLTVRAGVDGGAMRLTASIAGGAAAYVATLTLVDRPALRRLAALRPGSIDGRTG